MGPELTLKIPCQLDEISPVLSHIEVFGEDNHISPKVIYQVTLSVDEILTNIMTYAYTKGDHPALIDIALTLGDQSLDVMISDEGKYFNPLEAEAPQTSGDLEGRQIGGLGLHLVKTMMDEIDYTREGQRNILRLSKKIA